MVESLADDRLSEPHQRVLRAHEEILGERDSPRIEAPPHQLPEFPRIQVGRTLDPGVQGIRRKRVDPDGMDRCAVDPVFIPSLHSSRVLVRALSVAREQGRRHQPSDRAVVVALRKIGCPSAHQR